MASIALPYCVSSAGTFDFDLLHSVTKTVVVNTDRCVDISAYPTDAVAQAARSTRALGIGVQGLADVFMMMKIPFTFLDARQLNVSIFETIYHACLDASCELAQEHGAYPAWEGSPASRGILQVDMWMVTPSPRWNFDSLRARISQFGLRNSVLTALMPTMTTSKLMGYSESVEPYTRCVPDLTLIYYELDSCTNFSNAIVLRTMTESYPIICPHLVLALEARGLWSDSLRQSILNSYGILRSIVIIDTPLTYSIYRVYPAQPGYSR